MGFWSFIGNTIGSVVGAVADTVKTVTNVVTNTTSAFVGSILDSTTTVVSTNVVNNELQKIQANNNLEELRLRNEHELQKKKEDNKMITTIHQNLVNTVKSNVESFLKNGENISNELTNNVQTTIENIKDNNLNFYDFLRNIIIILLSYYIWCLNLAIKFHDVFIQFIIISSSLICITIILKMIMPIVDKENDRKSKIELEVIKEGYKIIENSSKDSTKVVCDANENSSKSLKIVTDYVNDNKIEKNENKQITT